MASVIEHQGRFLLVEEDTSEGVRWNQPAGHLEPGETIIEASVRETLEETAHDFTPVGLLGTYLASAGDKAYLRFAFVGTVGEPRPGFALDTGIRRAFWASLEDIQAHRHMLRHPVTLRCIEDYLSCQSEQRPWLPLASVAYLDDDVLLAATIRGEPA